MRFDDPTRKFLAKKVAACRDRLAEDISDQLQSTYGLYPDGTVLDVAITDDDKQAAADLLALLRHYQTAEASTKPQSPSRQPLQTPISQSVYQRLVREIGFTTLNRLAALRLAEERELVIECVGQGMTSAGFLQFDRLAEGALGNRYQSYRTFLENLFDELALDLGLLFDRHNPLSLIFPGEAALTEALKQLNDPELVARGVWQQDETIGWIYQYYNDPAERKAMRDASQSPRNSRELAVRNQFFTPRYVVEFLTDNTLGRTWYEMRRGDTRLVDECRYLVRRPNEVFLEKGQDLRQGLQDDDKTENPDNPAEGPVYIPFRAKKDPRRLKILDPACGSGHFLLYCFDLLLTIYEEAYSDPDLGPALQLVYPTLDELRRAAPELIVRHNLHGIDIDPRAAQIAALALWLRAQRAWQALTLRPAERPRITRTNIVVAESMPGDATLLDDFIRSLPLDRREVLGYLLKEMVAKMELAGEAGALLKIEVELDEAIKTARKLAADRRQLKQAALPGTEQTPTPEQLALDLTTPPDDAAFWDTAEQQVLDALRRYAEQAENGQGIRRRLFAEDAAQGFAFVDLCQKRFDVVLMNPPFGETTGVTARYFKGGYPDSKSDLATIFVERISELLLKAGVQGAITTRNPFLLSTSQSWREKVVFGLGNLQIFADLGMNVMDAAAVEAASYIWEKRKSKNQAAFIRLLLEEEKQPILLESVSKLYAGHNNELTSIVDLTEFLVVPGTTLCYWASPSMRKAFSNLVSLEDVASVEMGMSTKNDFRYLRCLWEIPPNRIGFENVWAPYAKGGESTPFSFTHDTLVLADREFSELKAELIQKYPYLKGDTGWVLHPEYSYGRPGLTYGRRVRRFSTNPLPPGFYFSEGSSTIFPYDPKHLLPFMSLLSSDVVRGFLGMITAVRKMEAGYIASIPIPDLDQSTSDKLSDLALQASEVQLARNCVDELSIYFVVPLFSAFGREQTKKLSRLDSILDQIEQTSFAAYQMSDDDRELIRREMQAITGLTTPSANFIRLSEKTTDLEQFDLSTLSYFIGIAFSRWDIRLLLDPTLVPELQGPFEPLPVCPPGMLVSPDGLPSTSGNIVSEAWLRARSNAITLPPEGSFDGPAAIPDEAYPLDIAWDGILVDDPNHPADIVRRVQDVLALLWPDNHEAIEAEACEILGFKSLRDYFRRPTAFFADHLKRYSKSRRQAPIYWPLSTPSGAYTLWLYYHRLTGETLYTAVNRYVSPKIEQVEALVARLEAELNQALGRSATDTRDQLDTTRAFLTELREFRDELLRIAGLPYQPDLNDGVIINAAPLHKLFRLRKWATATQKIWTKLENGDYDWSHLAYTLWPDQVREVCKKDRSIAIAHRLEALCEVEPVKPKKSKRKPKAKPEGKTIAMDFEEDKSAEQ